MTKIITVLIVVIIVFLCQNFPVEPWNFRISIRSSHRRRMSEPSSSSTSQITTKMLTKQQPTAEEILSWDATKLSHAIQKDCLLSCEELMKITLDHIDEVNPKCNAIILLQDRDDLLRQAQAADRHLKKYPHSCGWLHGIPVAIKDLSNVKGIPTTMGGSQLFQQGNLTPARTSDIYVENIQRDGAIVIGKTNTPEGGLGSNTFNNQWGATLNPFDLNRSAGGSSGGAAVAVATKMLSIADGTDNMGSLRNPAGWNHIYSLRPTAGMIADRKGGNDSSISAAQRVMGHPASTPGPMARSPRDLAYLLHTMAGGRDAFNTNNFPKSKNRTRIGWLGDWHGYLPYEDGILAQCRSALDTWSNSSSAENSVGIANVEESLPLFPFEDLWDAYNIVRFVSTLEKYSRELDIDRLLENRGKLIKEELAWEIEQGKLVTDNDLVRAKGIHERYTEWLRQIFKQFDVLALPSAQVWPFPIERRYPEKIQGKKMDTYHRWMEVCIPVSFGGLPCATVPAGFHGSMNLPIGIQLFSSRGQDLDLLSLANDHYEKSKRIMPGVMSVEFENALLSID